jgi:alpha-tubulin suppressor-like RCC1 family protein
MGGTTVCAIVNGGLKCWGDNYSGSVGNGLSGSSNQVVSSPYDTYASGAGVTQVAIEGAWNNFFGSEKTVCAVNSGGVECWGMNDNGQVGLGNNTNPVITTPTEVFATGSGVSKVAGSEYVFCAIKSGGVYCWGTNNYNLIGGSSVGSILPPTLMIAEGSGVTDIELSIGSVCAIKNEGLLCWGYNSYGQLGNGTVTSSGVPREVFADGSGVKEVRFTSGSHISTCARVNDTMKCWGGSAENLLGISNLVRDHFTVNGSGY